MNDDIVVTSFWRHDDDERLVSVSGKRRSPSLPEKTPGVQTDTDNAPCRDDDEHKPHSHKPGKRRSRSQPKKTRVQTDADTAPAKRSKKASTRRIRKWSKEEDARLEEGIELYKLPNWTLIAKHVKTRSNKMCSQRWRYNLRPESKLVRKGPWSEDEDRRLRQIVSKHTLKNESTWDRVSESMGFIRSNIQCRERWVNFLDPTLNSGPWTAKEDACLMSLCDERGNKWKKFTSILVGRSALHIRRRFDILRVEKKIK